MVNKYDPDVLDEINANADLLGYIEENNEVEQRGGQYWMHCDKHVDNTASLCISPEKNAFHCFSCGRGGYMINWLIEYEGMRFDDAVEKASRIANIDTATMCKSETISFLKRMRKTVSTTKETYRHEIYPKSNYEQYSKESITDWISEGISQEVMDIFEIRIDKRSNRIVYPVYDDGGNFINVKGRTRYSQYKALKIPKYINYHDVGVVDYFQGMNVNRGNIKSCGEIIIFESIKSVMLAYGWGFKNCVSAEKHTLTDEQIQIIVKMRVDVVIAYDSDVDYRSQDVAADINKLRMVTNVYVVEDSEGLLGGKDAKNAPVDCGEEIWKELYENKRKVV